MQIFETNDIIDFEKKGLKKKRSKFGRRKIPLVWPLQHFFWTHETLSLKQLIWKSSFWAHAGDKYGH